MASKKKEAVTDPVTLERLDGQNNEGDLVDNSTPVVEDKPDKTDLEATESIVERLQGDIMLLTSALTATRKLIFVMSKHVGADNALIQAGVDPSELHRLTARELKGKR